jgi:hypothetical protein
VPRQTSEIFIGYSLFSSSGSKVGLIVKIEIRRDIFSPGSRVSVQKKTCSLRSHFLPDIFMVESAENGTGYNPQFPLFVGADCICLPRNHSGPLPEFPVRDYCAGDHEIQTLASLARHMAGGF